MGNGPKKNNFKFGSEPDIGADSGIILIMAEVWGLLSAKLLLLYTCALPTAMFANLHVSWCIKKKNHFLEIWRRKRNCYELFIKHFCSLAIINYMGSVLLRKNGSQNSWYPNTVITVNFLILLSQNLPLELHEPDIVIHIKNELWTVIGLNIFGEDNWANWTWYKGESPAEYNTWSLSADTSDADLSGGLINQPHHT